MQVDDSNTFPSAVGATFPNNFKDIVKKIFKRLFRVYAHIYRSHFHQMCQLKAEAHLNTCFKHFILFAKVPTPPALDQRATLQPVSYTHLTLPTTPYV